MATARPGRRSALLGMLLVVALTAACGDAGEDATGEPQPTETDPDTAAGEIRVRSAAFSEGEPIPAEHTCDGEDRPPPLRWEGVPEGAASIAVLVVDPDAPSGEFVHWAVAGISPEADSLDGPLPEGAVEGENDFGQQGWAGPCPPAGDEAHRYLFTVSALDGALELEPGFTAQELENAMRGSVTAQGTVSGTYGR